MGKASRAKRERPPRRPREDLLVLLEENREFLRSSSAAFDSGYEAEAKRLAVVLRVLLHQTAQSHSILDQLGLKDRLDFLDTASPIRPGNLLPTPGLVLMRMTTTGDGAAGRYIAPLDMERPTGTRMKAFAGWWNDPVMKVDGTWSRKELVLTLANREGGAHVDPSLNDRYESLAKRNGLGFVSVSDSGQTPLEGDPIAAAVRQVAYEVTETLDRGSQLLK